MIYAITLILLAGTGIAFMAAPEAIAFAHYLAACARRYWRDP